MHSQNTVMSGVCVSGVRQECSLQAILSFWRSTGVLWGLTLRNSDVTLCQYLEALSSSLNGISECPHSAGFEDTQTHVERTRHVVNEWLDVLKTPLITRRISSEKQRVDWRKRQTRNFESKFHTWNNLVVHIIPCKLLTSPHSSDLQPPGKERFSGCPLYRVTLWLIEASSLVALLNFAQWANSANCEMITNELRRGNRVWTTQRPINLAHCSRHHAVRHAVTGPSI